MSGMSDLVAVVVPTALGSSVISTLITTYAIQTRERRRARAEVRATMRSAQAAAAADEATVPDQMQAKLDEFVRAAQLARLPMPLVDLYVGVTRQIWAMGSPYAPEGTASADPEVLDTATKVAAEAFTLLVSATWRPHRTRLKVWRRTRRYRRILVGGIPELDAWYVESKSRTRTWERDLLRKERRERRTRHHARRHAKSPNPAAP
jgi:hypothetical protein